MSSINNLSLYDIVTYILYTQGKWATKLVKLYTVYHKLQFLLSYIESGGGSGKGGWVKSILRRQL